MAPAAAVVSALMSGAHSHAPESARFPGEGFASYFDFSAESIYLFCTQLNVLSVELPQLLTHPWDSNCVVPARTRRFSLAIRREKRFSLPKKKPAAEKLKFPLRRLPPFRTVPLQRLAGVKRHQLAPNYKGWNKVSDIDRVALFKVGQQT